MKIVRHIPIFAFLLVFYNLLAFSAGDAASPLEKVWLTTDLVSGAVLRVTVSDLIIMLGIASLYAEIFKATRPTQLSILDHVLSMLVFVIYLVEFLVFYQVGQAAFLILTLMSFLDVIAGFTVTIVAARRDITMN
ncbi:MAG: hypothetical protein ACLFRG_01255 [Desulfococcaceae bacterium]